MLSVEIVAVNFFYLIHFFFGVPVTEYFYIIDVLSVSNNTRITTISCHTRFLFAIIMPWHIIGSYYFMRHVYASIEQNYSHRYERGKTHFYSYYTNLG